MHKITCEYHRFDVKTLYHIRQKNTQDLNQQWKYLKYESAEHFYG